MGQPPEQPKTRKQAGNEKAAVTSFAVADGRTFLLSLAGFDLDAARLDASLRGVGYDEGSKRFWASTDFFWEQGLAAMTAKICQAHGFALNHENMLACLDAFSFGMLAHATDAASGKIGGYLPAACFTLPSAGADGPLLRLFYQEVEQLVQARLAVKGSQGGKEAAPEEKKQLRQQIDYLTLKNEELRRQVQGLSQSEAAVKGYRGGNESLELHIGKVKEIDLPARKLTVRTLQKTLTLHFEELAEIPQEGEDCAVFVDTMVRPHKFISFRRDDRMPPVSLQPAKVLAQRGNVIKIRTEAGAIWQLRDKGEGAALRRGQSIVAVIQDNHLLAIHHQGNASERRCEVDIAIEAYDALVKAQEMPGQGKSPDGGSLNDALEDEGMREEMDDAV